jgi:hypothetical protein
VPHDAASHAGNNARAPAAVVVGPTWRRPLYDLLLVFKTLQVIGRHRSHLLHAHGYVAALAAGLCRAVAPR